MEKELRPGDQDEIIRERIVNLFSESESCFSLELLRFFGSWEPYHSLLKKVKRFLKDDKDYKKIRSAVKHLKEMYEYRVQFNGYCPYIMPPSLNELAETIEIYSC